MCSLPTVLASQSPTRRSILFGAGIHPLIRPANVDEDALIAAMGGADPATVVTALAEHKSRYVAESLRAEMPDCCVIGGDSMLHLNGQLCGKPHTIEATIERWQKLRNNTATLYSGLSVVRVTDGHIAQMRSDCASAVVHFSDVTDDEIYAYAQSKEPLEVAGAFTLEGKGGWFIDRIDGAPSCVLGLSLPLLRSTLLAVGISPQQLWS